MKKITIKKGHVLQKEEDLNTKIFQVESGLFRSYSIDEKEKEHTYQFAPEDWIIADAMPNNKPYNLFIDSLEDAVIFQIGEDFYYLSNQPNGDYRCSKRNVVFCLSTIEQIEILSS